MQLDVRHTRLTDFHVRHTRLTDFECVVQTVDTTYIAGCHGGGGRLWPRHTKQKVVNELSKSSQYWSLFGCQGCHSDGAFSNNPESKTRTKGCHYDNPKVVTGLSLGCHWDGPFFNMAPNLGCQDENFLVVNGDDFDNFLVDNHKVVLLTTYLNTFRQPCILCVHSWLRFQLWWHRSLRW